MFTPGSLIEGVKKCPVKTAGKLEGKLKGMEMISSRNPATGEVLANIPVSNREAIRGAFQRAREAQKAWGAKSTSDRAEFLISLRETVLNRMETILEIVRLENGKPRFEALFAEVVPSLEVLSYFARVGPDLLETKDLSLSNPILLHRKSKIQRWPLGVVAVISPWNFPFFLPFAEIAMALLAGNAVIFKPSEVTPQIGKLIVDLCLEAGLPPGVLEILNGAGDVGSAIIDEKPAKIFFTGSVETGKKIMSLAARHLIPVNLELGGKDPMIVLPDADLDFATSAALWGGFMNSGQICASTERLLLHEDIAAPFLELLKKKASQLRIGPSTKEGGTDLGPITMERQKNTIAEQFTDAKSRGMNFVTGGEFQGDGRFLTPTVITDSSSEGVEASEVYQEESFGNVIAATTFKTPAEAVKKANDSRYGLVASIITKNRTLAEQMAKEIEAGSVLINEVAYTAGIPETPWGGLKDSGFGKKHSDEGLLEFVHTRHIHGPRASFLTHKSLWWFPYTEHQFEMFKLYTQFYRRSWFAKLSALPGFLWSFIQVIKKEPRL